MPTYSYDYDDVPFTNEILPAAELIDFTTIIPDAVMLYASASYLRNVSNTNTELTIPIGPNISPGLVWLSSDSDGYLPNDIFNVTRPLDEVIFPSDRDARILIDLTFVHDIVIYYKITKSDGNNFSNRREIRCRLVKEDGVTEYDSSLFAYNQPDSGKDSYIMLNGHILHSLGDLVRIKFNIAQDAKNADNTDSIITIFSISWTVRGLKP